MNFIPYGTLNITYDGKTIKVLNTSSNTFDYETLEKRVQDLIDLQGPEPTPARVQEALAALAKENTTVHDIQAPKYRSTKRMRRQLQKKLKRK